MRTFFATHNKALKAEAQKLRHSGMLWLCLGATAFIPVLMTIVGFFVDWDTNVDERWNRVMENNLMAFTGFFFPLFVVIMVVRLVYMEHRLDTWKLIETQPVSKAALYFAKWEIAVMISLASLAGLVLFAVIEGYILQYGRPSLKLSESSIDWGKTLKIVSRYWVASLGIISIQYFLSLLIKSFAWPMSIGLIGIIAGSIFAGFGFLNWWPWAATNFTSQSYSGSVSGQYFMPHEKISMLWSVLFLWLGYQLYRRKTFGRAFFSPIANLGLMAAVIAVFSLLIWVVNKPTVISRYEATVVAGKITTKVPITQVVLLRPPLMDTVFSIPVVKDEFHLRSEHDLAPGIYYLRAGNNRAEFFMGGKDSVFVDWTIDEKKSDTKLTGTRLAENAYLQKREGENFSFLVDFAYMQSPSEFAFSVMKQWKDALKSVSDFKTVDRIRLGDDFVTLRKKLISMKLLSIVDGEYPKIHAAYFPNQELKYPKAINRIRAEAGMNAPELISFPEYRAYVRGAARNISGINDSLYFSVIQDSIKDQSAKDLVVFEAAQESVFRIRDSSKRAALLNALLPTVQNDKVRSRLVAANQRANNLQRGRTAFDFAAEALNGKEIKLSSLSGKYVVIDFWATWCVPCKRESPYFEDYAARYTSEQLAFVSVSVDEDKRAWRFDANYKKDKRVLQLLAKDQDQKMAEAFALNSIPRFMLIDPKGKIINAQMPNPSDPDFEATLQKEIPTLSRYQ